MEESNKTSFWQRYGFIIVGVGFMGGAVFLVALETFNK
jgi:hypothetical protein